MPERWCYHCKQMRDYAKGLDPMCPSCGKPRPESLRPYPIVDPEDVGITSMYLVPVSEPEP